MESSELAVLFLTGGSVLNVFVAAVMAWLRARRSKDDVAVTIRVKDGQEIKLTRDQFDNSDQLREVIARYSNNGETSADQHG
ncbi:effector-associated constant component EACC1 [Streptosporangium sp. V21-05]|uniref:effector-associated constant component EACC1 n=1 Tax=Streptosporangium sp. V21-05 TaxID=3446115 RepID=UPI003F52A201